MTTNKSLAGRRPEAVLFDLDGTLIDSAADITMAVNALLASRGLPPLDVGHVKTMIGEGTRKLVERAFSASGSPLDDTALDDADRDLMPLYHRHLTGFTTLMPGAAEAVARLHVSGVRLGLVTNKPQLAAREIMLHFRLAERFGVIVGGDAVTRKKPSPDALLFAVERLGSSPGNTLIVGDSVTDITAARAAGMPVILVRGGYSREPIETLGADMICDSLLSLPDIVQNMRRAA